MPDDVVSRIHACRPRSRCPCPSTRAPALHSIDTELARTCEVPAVEHEQEALRLLEETRRSGLPEGLRTGLDGCLRNYLDGGIEWSYTAAILNADLSPEHVLVDLDERRVAGVIDWALRASEAGRSPDVEHGVAALNEALHALRI